MAMHLDRQPDHPIGQWFRQQHNVLSVNTVFSALSAMKIAAIAAPGDRPGPFSAMAVRPRPLASSVLKIEETLTHRCSESDHGTAPAATAVRWAEFGFRRQSSR